MINIGQVIRASKEINIVCLFISKQIYYERENKKCMEWIEVHKVIPMHNNKILICYTKQRNAIKVKRTNVTNITMFVFYT